MGERPDEIGRREPLDRGFDNDPDPITRDPGFDPATDAYEPRAASPPAVRRESGGGDELETTRTDIERTRDDMSETIDAIQEKLNPDKLKRQAKDKVREVTVGTAQQVKEATVGKAQEVKAAGVGKAQDAGSGVVATIRSNPLPAAMTGIGLGWLLVSARKQGSSQSTYRASSQPTYRTQTSYRNEGYAYSSATNEDAPPVRDYSGGDYPSRYEDEGDEGGSAGQALGQARDRVGETASQAQEAAGQAVSRVQDRSSELTEGAKSRVSTLGSQAQVQARRASGGFQRMLRENPLAMGALSVGVGAGVGLAIPTTSKENEVMGEARDTVVEKAQEKAQEAQQKVQQVASEAQSAAQSAAKEEADNQGLTNQ